MRALVLAALLGACSFEADYGGSRYRCGGDAGGCPPGFACTAGGYCEVPGSADAQLDAAPGGDADPDQPDAAPVDVCDEAAAAPPADTCADAETRDLTADAKRTGGTVVYGDTTGYANTLQAGASNAKCIGVITTGSDAIYTVSLAANETLTATLRTEGWDSALYLVPACSNATTGCATGDDEDFDTDTMTQPLEQILHGVTEPATFYLVVDSQLIDSMDYSTGCFTLEVSIE